MKKITKKLVLNKKTISSLNDLEMSSIQGGTSYCDATPLTSAQCETSSGCDTGGGTSDPYGGSCSGDTEGCPVPSSYAASCNSCFHC